MPDRNDARTRHAVVQVRARLLDRVAVVDDLDTARALVDQLPEVTAVTREGDVLAAHVAAGGDPAAAASAADASYAFFTGQS